MTHTYDMFVCLLTRIQRERGRERETEKNRFPSTPTKGGNSPQHSMIHDYIACYNRRGQALKEKTLISSRIWPTSRHLSIRVMRSIPERAQTLVFRVDSLLKVDPPDGDVGCVDPPTRKFQKIAKKTNLAGDS